MDRRKFLSNALATAAASRFSEASQYNRQIKQFPLEEASVSELQDRMTRGELTSERITELYLERIGELDRNGPELRAVIELNPGCVDDCEELG